ncbi:YbaB/EbfC family DNA-binding protein [Actinoplanes sp. TBRC 11911]|uniref:YbaB/EbfC family nucleoid-associated protein n=1 Tax=Actinoplanes sp. TBRC 11911 TaxID=2729386 RepID=UPI00145DFBF6|nr:YbaB/EbfC family nucleoid-associated protein [Actinoplanes sp. TBRC 11911]NMO55375.1 YbaB/EbfC family DNA-binding protein [Actinoplanes sp. TBRC 11911]
MSSPMHDRIEQAYAEFEKKKEAIAGFENAIGTAHTTVTSKNRELNVTVDGRGDLTEIKFPTNAYRSMAPAELANLLVDTVRSAREKARAEAANMLESLLPARAPILSMLNNPGGFDQMMREAVRIVSEPFPGSKPTADGEQE